MDDADDQAMDDAEIQKNIEKAAANKEVIERKMAHSTFVGLPDSGKTSFMNRLFGKKVEEFSPSTGISGPVIIVDINLAKSSDLQSAEIDTDSWDPVECEDSFISQMEQETRPKCNKKSKGIELEFKDTDTIEESIQQSGSMVIKQGKPKFKFHETTCFSIIKQRGFKQFKKDARKTFSLYFRDAGGQVEFQELFGLLVSGPSLFFFLFDISRGLTMECRLEYRTDSTKSINCYESCITNKKALLQCLFTVSAMDISGDLKPRVFIVATHMDKLSEDERNATTDEMNLQLHSLIKNNNDFEDLVQYYDADKNKVMFEVDNKSDSDDIFRCIRSRVTNLVRRRKEFSIPFPIAYLMFCLDLRSRKECILTLDDIRKMAKVYNIKNDEVFELLKFLHSRIGIIQYFNVEGLDEVVVKEPQVLFDKVTELIVETFSKESLDTKEKKNLKEKGIFSLSVFDSATKEVDNISSDKLLKLLVCLRIVAPFTDADGKEIFFLPCILNHVPEGKMISSMILSLGIKFPSQHCPKGVFGVLVTQIMNPESDIRNDYDVKFQLKEEEIFRDQVTFTVECRGIKYGIMSIKMHSSDFEIIFDPSFSSSPSSSDDDDDDDDDNDNDLVSVKDICSTIRFILEKSIIKSAKKLHYKEERVKPVVCFRCDNCSGLHEVINDKKYQCGDKRPKRIPKEGRYWFEGGKH